MAPNVNVESAIGLLVASLCILLSLWIGASPNPPKLLCEYEGALDWSYVQLCGLLIFAATTINLLLIGKRVVTEFM